MDGRKEGVRKGGMDARKEEWMVRMRKGDGCKDG